MRGCPSVSGCIRAGAPAAIGVLALCCTIAAAAARADHATPEAKSRQTASRSTTFEVFDRLPLSFEENGGHANSDASTLNGHQYRAAATSTARSATTNRATLSVNASVHPPPTLTAVTPVEALNDAALSITLTGSNFQSGAAVQLGTTSLTVTSITGGAITATVPTFLPGGPYDVRVTNPDNQSATLTSAFTVLASTGGMLDAWQMTSAMGKKRAHFGAVAIGNHVYALGGQSDSRHYIIES